LDFANLQTLAASIRSLSDADIEAFVSEHGAGSTLERTFAALTAAFLPEKAPPSPVTIAWKLDTAGGPLCAHLSVDRDGCRFEKGEAKAPQATLSTTVPVLLRLVCGVLSGMQAYAHGRLQVEGDMVLALRQVTFFDIDIENAELDLSTPEELARLIEGRSDAEIMEAAQITGLERVFEKVFQGMVDHFLPEKAAGHSGVIEWKLLTTLSVETLEDACHILKLYSHRWLIEQFFRVLKTGCKIEERQFEKAERLAKMHEIRDFRERAKIDFIMEDVGDLFSDSKEGLERVTGIIQNLRDFSRIDQPQDVGEYDLNEGLRATLVVARNEIKYDANIELDLSDLPPVTCHSGQINQVFLNLLVNAAHAIKSLEREEKGTIRVRTHDTETHVMCEVSDDGPGIPPEIISKVFDPFFTTKPPGKGTGLGLSVSYDIVVNKHRGELSVVSEVGQGTTFSVKLPKQRSLFEEKKETPDEAKHRAICG